MMRRSPLKPGTKGLKSAGFARAERIEARGYAKATRKAAPARKAGMKSRGPRMTPIRRAAAGQDCTLQLPGCNRDPATTVLCHSNYLADGKGMGLKAPDHAAAFGCSACHDVLDGRRPRPAGLSLLDVEGAFYAGMLRTQQILRRLGLMPAAPTNIETE